MLLLCGNNFYNVNVVIRECQTSDFEAIFTLLRHLAAFQQAEEKLTNTVSQLQEDHEHFHCLVAENERQEIVGIASYFFAYFSWSGRSLYLDDLFVKEEARHQNVGTKLLQAIFTKATMAGCKKIRWQVSEWNTNALQLYEKMGAQIERQILNCDFEEEAIKRYTATYLPRSLKP